MTSAWYVLLPVAAAFVLYTAWVCWRFVPTVVRIFEETPLLRPARHEPEPGAEQVQLVTEDGVTLRGSWLAGRTSSKRGTVIFCHEFLSDRWSCRPYCDPLRDEGYDVFTFDFRCHGQSGPEAAAGRGDSHGRPCYRPSQWVSDREVSDVRAAVAYVLQRIGGAGTGLALFGVSRGGGAALIAAAEEPAVDAVVADSAFSTHLTQMQYMRRWVGIYLDRPWLYRLTPSWYFALVGWLARRWTAWRHRCRFPKLERALRRLPPRPVLLIHGQRDSYISPEIAEELFQAAGHPKQLWIVPGAKHNGAVGTVPQQYASRLKRFLSQALPAPEQHLVSASTRSS